MDENQDRSVTVPPQGRPSLFCFAVLFVKDGNGPRIQKDLGSPLKAPASSSSPWSGFARQTNADLSHRSANSLNQAQVAGEPQRSKRLPLASFGNENARST
jgi:hypothetical protein